PPWRLGHAVPRPPPLAPAPLRPRSRGLRALSAPAPPAPGLSTLSLHDALPISADIPTPFLRSATRSGKHVALFQLEVPCTLLAGTDNPAPPRRGRPRKPLHSRRMSSSCDEQPQ